MGHSGPLFTCWHSFHTTIAIYKEKVQMLFLQFKPGVVLTNPWLEKLHDQTLKQVDS